MRIIFVTSHPIQYQVPIFRHLAAMKELDFEVFFATIPDSKTQGAGFGVEFEWDIPLLEGFRYQVLQNIARKPSVTDFRGCDTPSIGQVLKENRPDAVIVNGWVVKTCIQALLACKRLAIPCVVRGEANDLADRPWWKRTLQRLLVSQYSACLYIGKANKKFYKTRGVPESNLYRSPYCIENDRFTLMAQNLADQRDQIRRGFNIDNNRVCFLFCGKFENKKQPRELLDSFHKAASQNKEIHLLMVGDGELKESCEHFAAEQGLPVTFTGFLNQAEIVKAYVAADCLVLPSNAGETWGLVVNEAMACGLPAIVSDRVGCAADLLERGNTGEVFEYGNWTDLGLLMADLAGNPARLVKWGEAARRRVRLYSPEAAAAGILEALAHITENSLPEST